MRKLQIKHLNEKDEEIVDALISLGMNRPVARVLAYLQQVNEVTSSELELGTDLRLNTSNCIDCHNGRRQVSLNWELTCDSLKSALLRSN